MKITEGSRIKGRYKITTELSSTDLEKTYQVKDLDHPEKKSFIATRFSPMTYIKNNNERVLRVSRLGEFQKDKISVRKPISLKIKGLIGTLLNRKFPITILQILGGHNPENSFLLSTGFEFLEIPLNDIQEAFSLSIKNLGQVCHRESIPDLIATFEEDGEFYIIQELIEGQSLNDSFSHSRSWEQSKVLDLLIKILEILVLLHKSNIKHLNLHPGCFRYRIANHQLVLTDFAVFQGIVAAVVNTKLDGNLIQMGIPGYAAPEQAQGQCKFSSDIYAVGMMGVQALTGIHPTKLLKDPETGTKIWRYAIPDQNTRLVKILEGMTANAFQRYRDATDVLETLQNLRAQQQQEIDRKRQDLKNRQEQCERQEKENAKADRRQRQRKYALLILCLILSVGSFSLGPLVYQLYQRTKLEKYVRDCQINFRSEEPNLANTTLTTLAMKVDAACENVLINSQASIRDQAAAQLQRGIVSLVLWKNEKELGNQIGAEVKLTEAIASFTTAAEHYGQASFYLGLSTVIQAHTPSQSNSPQPYFSSLFEEYSRAAEDYYKNHRLVDNNDIPILVKLAFFRIRIGNYNSQDIENVNQIFEKAKEHQPESLPLKYNHAILNISIGNYQEAIALLGGVANQVADNSDMHDFVYQTLGFVHLKLALSELSWSIGLNNFNAAQEAFSKIKSSKEKEIFTPYQELLERCITTPNTGVEEHNAISCNPSVMISQIVSFDKNENELFPIFPVYSCQENPALAITEEALTNKVLEPAFTELCSSDFW